MRLIFLASIALLLVSCSENSKDFSSVKIGMTSQEVLQVAGEPSKKRDIALANLWIYEKSDRTVIFRKDTVFDIITSANARVDTIERSLDKMGDKIKTQAKKAGKKIDSLSRILKIGSPKDSVKK